MTGTFSRVCPLRGMEGEVSDAACNTYKLSQLCPKYGVLLHSHTDLVAHI